MFGCLHRGTYVRHCRPQCVLNIFPYFQLAPGDDLIMSNMYSLLNYIASASKEMHESSGTIHPIGAGGDGSIAGSTETGLRGLSEEEVRLVGISTISVVTRLALEFKTEEVCSMLKMGSRAYCAPSFCFR